MSVKTIAALGEKMRSLSMRALFENDPGRAQKYWAEACGITLDYSKNLITDPVMQALFNHAETAGLERKRAAMFAGEKINLTENRAVLHVALRDEAENSYAVDGKNVMPLIEAERARMKRFCDEIHTGKRLGYTGKPLTTVVNIGIGGSDLGPVMVTEALKPYWLDGRAVHFVSNVDGTHITETLKKTDPETTLFLIASKTFTTQETMTNAHTARHWLLAKGGGDAAVANHFVALSTNGPAVQEFGIDADNMFQFWDWVGGRYSLWSVIGLSIALTLGYANFARLLAGARAMDRHFVEAPMAENLPILMALLGVWNRNGLGIGAHAVLPYDQYLHRLPAYLQQADMESNGKATTLDGKAALQATGPVIFGEPGTNGQHAFYQLIHQGTDRISTDFIAPALSHNERGDHHPKLLANFLAQTAALMRGKTLQEVEDEMAQAGYDSTEIARIAPHRVFPGNRPSNSLLVEKVTPETLGALIALYEHKIFCQGVLWGINSFDQWGVELGKKMAGDILPELGLGGEKNRHAIRHDASTNRLIDRINSYRDK